jgi:hypothetical protein
MALVTWYLWSEVAWIDSSNRRKHDPEHSFGRSPSLASMTYQYHSDPGFFQRRTDDEGCCSVQSFPSEVRPKSDGGLHVTWPRSREVKTNGLGGLGRAWEALTFSIDMRLAVFLRVLCELMPGYSLKMLGASICGYVVLG